MEEKHGGMVVRLSASCATRDSCAGRYSEVTSASFGVLCRSSHIRIFIYIDARSRESCWKSETRNVATPDRVALTLRNRAE